MKYEAKHFKEGSRSYNGVYTDKRNKKHHIRVKIVDRARLAKYTTALVLVTGVGLSIVGSAVAEVVENNWGNKAKEIPEQKPAVIAMVDEEKEPVNHVETEEKNVTDKTKNEVAAIINKKPHILKDVSEEKYTVQFGDSLGSIAVQSGNTIERICIMNHLNRNDVLYQGTELNLEVLKDKEPVEKDIAALESYFGDFVLHSSGARENRGLIFGNSDNVNTDPNSILGQFIKAYTTYHGKLESPGEIEMDEDTKSNYIDTLTRLANEVDRGINVIDGINYITPYEQYRIYLENGTTEYEELNEHYHSIYR